eukprot:jgi/Picre1/27545/NNA_000512.t1
MFERKHSTSVVEAHSSLGRQAQNGCDSENVMENRGGFRKHRRSKSAMLPSLGLSRQKSKSVDAEHPIVTGDVHLKSKEVFQEVKKLEFRGPVVPSAKRGVANTGNSCFLSSVLQCLFATPGVAAMLAPDICDEKRQDSVDNNNSVAMDESNEEEGRQSEAEEAAEDVPQTAGQAERPEKGTCGRGGDHDVSALPLVQVLKRYPTAAEYFNGAQQDTQEVLMALLDLLDQDLYENSDENGTTEDQKSDTKVTHVSELEKAACAWNSVVEKSSTLISENFLGQLQSCVLCETCKTRFTMYEPFLELSLSLAPKASKNKALFNWLGFSSPSLSDCLFEYTSDALLEGDELFDCEKCQCKTRATKQMKLHRLPKALIFHMKRFKHSAKSTEKIDKFVKFPLQGLDLRHHVSLECPHPPEECIYDLYAVANHSGTLTVGHYTAYNLVEEEEEEKGEKTYHWVQCNDDVVLKIAKEVVVSNNAYLLFYARRTFIDKDSAAKAYANLDNVEQRSWIGNTI